MKSVFIAGSRKFYEEMQELENSCKDNNIKILTSGEWDENEEDNLENQKSALLRAFENINKSDLLYVFAKEGYIGKTVAMEIAYAYAKNKEIISSEEIKELSAQALVSKIMKPNELIEFCKLS